MQSQTQNHAMHKINDNCKQPKLKKTASVILVFTIYFLTKINYIDFASSLNKCLVKRKCDYTKKTLALRLEFLAQPNGLKTPYEWLFFRLGLKVEPVHAHRMCFYGKTAVDGAWQLGNWLRSLANQYIFKMKCRISAAKSGHKPLSS